MNNTLLLLLATAFIANVHAQCPPDHLVLSSQADVDAFAASYPNCTVLPGDLTISVSTPDFTDLEGLGQLTAVVGKIFIPIIIYDIPMDGLQNIQSARSLIIGSPYSFAIPTIWFGNFEALGNIAGHLDSLFIGNSFVETFGTDFPNITSIGHLNIFNNESLTEIPTFPALESVRELWFSSNTQIQQINLPENISTIAFWPGQDTIYQLRSGIFFEQNSNLQTITSSAPFTSLNELYISYNDLLHTINGFENLDSINDGFTLSVKHPTAFNTFHNVTYVESANIELSTEQVFEQQDAIYLALGENANNLTMGSFSVNTGLSNSFTFPAQMTSVSGNMSVQSSALIFSTFEVLMSVGGYLRLNFPSFTQIPAMPQLTNIGGDLDFINFNGAANLLNFEGLNALTTIGGKFRIGRSIALSTPLALTSLNGLESLIEVGATLSIRNLVNLEDISAIQNLNTIAGTFHVDNLPLISEDELELPNLQVLGGLTIEEMPFINISTFPEITTLAGDLSLLNNALLIGTAGLSEIESIGGNITVQGNPVLSQMNFNNDLNFSGNFILTNNPALEGCDENMVCAIIELAETSEISGNGPTCETLEEVLAGCSVGTDDASSRGVLMFQNSAGHLVIQLERNFGNSNLSLYDMQGRTVLQDKMTFTEGIHHFPLPQMAQGIYIVEISGETERVATRISLMNH